MALRVPFPLVETQNVAEMVLYYYFFVVVALGAAYVWANKKYGRAASFSSWRNALNQNWALYRRRLLKRTRSQTPPVGYLGASISTEDNLPLLLSDEDAATASVHLELRSVASDGVTPPNSASVLGPTGGAPIVGGGSSVTSGGVRRTLEIMMMMSLGGLIPRLLICDAQSTY